MIFAFLLPVLSILPAQEPLAVGQDAVVTAAPREDQVSIYDVGDLVGAKELEDLRSAIVRTDIPKVVRIAALDEYTEILEAGTVVSATKNLAESIRTFVEPRATEGFRVTAAGLGELVVVGTAAQHEWVGEFLDSMRAFDGFVDIQLKMYKVPQGHLGALVGGRSGVALDKASLKKLLADLDALDDAEVVTAPRVMVHAGAPAEISTLDQTAYVKDFKLTVLPDVGQEIADPIIDVVQTGITFHVQAIPLGAERLGVKVDFTYSTAKRPFPQKTIPIGASGNEVTIQLPEITTTKASARFDLLPGGAVVLSTVDPDGDEDGEEPRDVLVLMQAQRVDAAPQEPGEPKVPADPFGGRRRDK